MRFRVVTRSRDTRIAMTAWTRVRKLSALRALKASARLLAALAGLLQPRIAGVPMRRVRSAVRRYCEIAGYDNAQPSSSWPSGAVQQADHDGDRVSTFEGTVECYTGKIYGQDIGPTSARRACLDRWQNLASSECVRRGSDLEHRCKVGPDEYHATALAVSRQVARVATTRTGRHASSATPNSNPRCAGKRNPRRVGA
jgi:hypothetical protein